MGDIPESRSRCRSWTCPRSRHRYRPGRSVRSAEHARVVPDVPPALPRAGSGANGLGETPCQRHVSPHNPDRCKTTVNTPRPAGIRPRFDQPGPPQSVVIMSARTSTPPAPSATPTASLRGQRLVHRSAATAPQVTVGSGGNHRHRPLQASDPIHPLGTHCPTPAPAPMSLTSSPVISRGNANNPICHTPSASMARHIVVTNRRGPREA